MRRTPMEHISQVYNRFIWRLYFYKALKPNESVSSITEGRKLSISHPALHQTGRQGPHTGDTTSTDVLVTPTNNTTTSWKRYACDVISLAHWYFFRNYFKLGRQLKIHLYSHNIEGVTDTIARISQNSEVEDYLSEARLKLAQKFWVTHHQFKAAKILSNNVLAAKPLKGNWKGRSVFISLGSRTTNSSDYSITKIRKCFDTTQFGFIICAGRSWSVEILLKTISSYVTKLSLAESDPYYEKLQSAKRKLETFIDAHQGSR